MEIWRNKFFDLFLQLSPEKTALVSSVDTAVIKPVQKPGKNGNSEKLNVQPHLGTAGRMVGLRAFMSAVRVLRLPE